MGVPCAVSILLFATLLSTQHIYPLNAEINPNCHLLALLAHHIFHVSGLRANIREFNLIFTFYFILVTFNSQFTEMLTD